MISKREWWLTKDGKAVPYGDPKGATVLVGAGGAIPDADAERYGLPELEAAADKTEAKAVEGPPEDKAVKAAPRTKAKK